jgi:hypothetical protein
MRVFVALKVVSRPFGKVVNNMILFAVSCFDPARFSVLCGSFSSALLFAFILHAATRVK